MEKEKESRTYSFDPTGREQYVKPMKEYGYMEFAQFKPHMDGFCCASCQALRKNNKSPTGFWCSKYAFPDKPEGCCDGYHPVQGLIKNGERGQETS